MMVENPIPLKDEKKIIKKYAEKKEAYHHLMKLTRKNIEAPLFIYELSIYCFLHKNKDMFFFLCTRSHF